LQAIDHGIRFEKSTTNGVSMKRVTKIISWTGLFPLLGPMAILFYYIKARLYLGHFPIPSVPDPKDLPFHTTYTVVETITAAAFFLEVLILAWLAILVIRIIFVSPVENKALYLLLGGRVLFWFFCFTTIFEWFLD
jgi:hypothetical protein